MLDVTSPSDAGTTLLIEIPVRRRGGWGLWAESRLPPVTE
jgi:hypothetical protein